MMRKRNYGIRYPYQDRLKDNNNTNYGAWIPSNSSDMELFMESYNKGKHVREFIPRDYVPEKSK